MNISRNRRQHVDNSIWGYMALIGIFFIALGLVLNAYDAADLRDTTAKIANLENRRVELYQNAPIAEREYVDKSPLYPKYLSEGFDKHLTTARYVLEPNGTVQQLAADAQKALDSGNRELAKSTWEIADKQLLDAESIIRRILGPPSYYAELQRKVGAIKNGYLGNVQQKIDAQRTYVVNKPTKYLCGTSSILSYASAFSQLDLAQDSLETAKNTATTVLPEGVIDYPRAYDQAVSAANQADLAATIADNLSSGADGAAAEIVSCQSSISIAEGELVGAYDSDGALSNYNSALTEKQNAINSCSSQKFSDVSSHVSSCIAYADQSYDDAQPPPPTAVPQVQSDDDDDDDESTDYNIPDFGTGGGDDNTYNGGSEDYTQDDGYNYSDDYSSDDNYYESDDYTTDDGYLSQGELMGTTPLVIGFVILLAAGLGWLFSNPDKIEVFRKTLQSFRSKASRSQGELTALKGDLTGTNRVSDSAPKELQFTDLKLGETVQFSPDREAVIGRPELGVSGLGWFHALENLGRGQFSPRGEEWFAITLDNGTQLFSRPEGWYCFTLSNVETLGPEGAEIFAREGLVFCDPLHRQLSGSHSFVWKRRKLTVLDVGYLETEVLGGDLFTIPPGMNIKYMLCRENNGGIVFVENRRAGVDRVWLGGISLGPNIKPYLGRLTRAV